jgi:DNA polymerase-3 subunit alpha
MTKEERLAFEKEMLGQYVTEHPLDGLEHVLACQTDSTLATLGEQSDGAVVTVAGIVNKVGKKFTRKGELMFLVQLEDLEAVGEVIVFPAVAEKSQGLVAVDKVLCIKGRVDRKEDVPKLVALEVSEPNLSILEHSLRVTVDAGRCNGNLVGELKQILKEFPGSVPVFLHLRTGKRTTVLRLGPDFRVDPDGGCVDRLRLLLGAAAVQV